MSACSCGIDQSITCIVHPERPLSSDLMCDECGTTDPDDFIQDSLFESLCIKCITEQEMTELNDDYPRDLDPTEELNFEDGIYNQCSPLVDVRDWE